MKKIFALFSAILLAACVSTGREVKSDQLSQFTKGKSTIADVTAALGQPTSTSITSDGNKTLNYMFAHSQARPESFIPLVGAFVGGADYRSSFVTFNFDNHGVLVNYAQSESNGGVGTGLSSGTYTAPDRTQPQEQPRQ